jgi:phosphoinositide-3-kinase regulatory subunit 4
VFPESFYSFLHNYVAAINEMPSNPPFTNSVSTPSTTAGTVKSTSSVTTVTSPPTESQPDVLPSDSDHRLERICADYESIEPYIIQDSSEEAPMMDVKIEYNALAPLAKPFQVRVRRWSSQRWLTCD